MKSKRIILFLVEGVSERSSLGLILSRICRNEDVQFFIVGGDLTSDNRTQIKTAINKVNEKVNQFRGNIFKKTDILKIIHLVDTDGAYITSDNIQETNVEKVVYEPECIKAKNADRIIKRNELKSNILNKLSLTKTIGGINYELYYFSSNLDHVLYNKQNLLIKEKDKMADDFSDQYYGKEEEFIKFISKSDFSVNGDYKESWNFIKEDNNSLKRYSNFHLFLN